jgi:beta-lactamase regulating signal transducer with metallopeptidase domain
MMSSVADAISAWSHAWLATMWAVAWQSCVLVALAAVAVTLVLRTAPPSHRFWMWQVVAMKLLILPFCTVCVPYAPPSPTFGKTQVLSTSTEPTPKAQAKAPLVSLAIDTVPARQIESAAQSYLGESLFVLWLAVCLLRFVRIAFQYRSLGRLVVTASPCDIATEQEIARGCQKLGISRAPRCLVTDRSVAPFACGLWHPTIVLPRSLIEPQEAAELQRVLLHELAHLRRKDLIWLWVPYLMRTFYWFHPVAHYLTVEIALERELACDALAMEHSNSTVEEYVRTLTDIVSKATSGLSRPVPIFV